LTKKCEPTCIFFRCAQKALIIKGKKFQRYKKRNPNTPQKRGMIALCSWAGDLCQGYECTYGYCERRALLPDGTCGLELRKERIKVKSIEEEAKKEDLRFRLKGKTLKRIKELDYIE